MQADRHNGKQLVPRLQKESEIELTLFVGGGREGGWGWCDTREAKYFVILVLAVSSAKVHIWRVKRHSGKYTSRQKFFS